MYSELVTNISIAHNFLKSYLQLHLLINKRRRKITNMIINNPSTKKMTCKLIVGSLKNYFLKVDVTTSTQH